jgi:hypothetical protein
LNWDIFQNPAPSKTTASGATSTNAANAPTADGSTPSAAVAPTVVTSKFAAGDAGAYLYAVSAVNRFGESALTVLGTAVTVAANGAVDLKFTATASTNAATCFQIYRGTKGSTVSGTTTFYPIFTINLTQLAAGYDGAAANLVRDNNRWLTNTYQAMLIQGNTEVMEFKQLAPLMKMDLAITSPCLQIHDPDVRYTVLIRTEKTGSLYQHWYRSIIPG